MCSYSFTGYMRVILSAAKNLCTITTVKLWFTHCPGTKIFRLTPFAQDDGVHISFAMKGCHIGDSCPHIEKLPYLL